ncbi:MAG: hypothetical protein JNM18_03150 [Planctomycetaceae bacterium]|nr:hypothetical protein [Planctomycetaceae bacterium]
MEYDPPDPCPTCGGLAFWWSLAGEHHCTQCDPPTKAIEWLDRAQRIRDKLRLPANTLADRMLVDLRQLTNRD